MTTQTLNKPHYGTFTIDRSYAHSPERVFRAFENADAFYRWFISGEGWEIGAYSHDFRVGGRDQSKFRPEGHPEWFGNDTWYLEIEKARRIVTAYSMSAEGKPLSTRWPSSNSTVTEKAAAASCTRSKARTMATRTM